MKFDFSIIAERKKEIIIVLGYIAVFVAMLLLMNNFQEDKKALDEELYGIERRYNKIKNIQYSEEELKAQYAEKEKEYNEMIKIIPTNLKNQDINNIMAKIASNTGNLFNLGNVKVTELKSDEQDSEDNRYIKYQVKVSSIKGTYKQINKLIHYIDEFESKIKIENTTLKRDFDQIDGSMTLIFYSYAEGGEEGEEV